MTRQYQFTCASILEELANFLDFCREYGIADYNNFKSYEWQQYNKFNRGRL